MTALEHLRTAAAELRDLFKARRSKGTTTQVRAHLAHDAHGVHMVAAHTRHLTPREAIRLKAAELRAHVASGGPAAEVAQAEIDRRAAKRSAANPPEAAEPSPAPAPRRRQRTSPGKPVGPVLPSWVPRPARGGKYTKAEREAVRTQVWHGRHPEVAELVAEGRALTEDLEQWAEAHGLPETLVHHVLAGDRYHGITTIRRTGNVFEADIQGAAQGRSSTMRHIEDGHIRAAEKAELSTPEGLAAWWGREWSGSRDYYRGAMQWWSAHRGVLDPLRDPDAVIDELVGGYEDRHVTAEQAFRLLRDVHKIPWVASPYHQYPSDGETSVRDLLTGKVSPAAAAARYEADRAATAARHADTDQAEHATASKLVEAMAALRARGRSPHHGPNLARAIPGLRVEVKRLGDGYEVTLDGGPLRGRLRMIGPHRPTRDEAWAALEAKAEAIAAGGPGTTYRKGARVRPIQLLADERAALEALIQ